MSEGSGGFFDKIFNRKKTPSETPSMESGIPAVPPEVLEISQRIQELNQQTEGFSLSDRTPQDRALRRGLEERARTLGYEIGRSGEPLLLRSRQTQQEVKTGFTVDVLAQQMADARRQQAGSGDQPVNTNPASQALSREQPTPPLTPDKKPEAE